MKQIQFAYPTIHLSFNRIFPVLFLLFVNTSGQFYGLDISDIQLVELNSSVSAENQSTGNSEISHGIRGYPTNSILYSSNENDYYNNLYKRQKRKYGIMSAVWGTLSVTSIILMSVGDWEKTTTGNSVNINATDGASTTGLIISLIAFPMTIYSLIRLSLNAGKKVRYTTNNPKIQPIVAYDTRDKTINTVLKLHF